MSAVTIQEKTMRINSDPDVYGTIAEIGAGQETARWFFRTKGTSNTIAKAMSAYDMSFSDAIYGREESGRYVSESRVKKMLDHEYELLVERLKEARGDRTRFFAFGNTIAARSKRTGETGRGWVGVKWQKEIGSEPCEIHLHVTLFDKRNTFQQEAAGMVGVNLIYAAFFYADDVETFVESLRQDIDETRVQIDHISCRGNLFKGVDSRVPQLMLVQKGLTSGVAFAQNGKGIQPGELFYHKNLVIFRGQYRPICHYHLDLLECAQHQLATDIKVKKEDVLCVAEIPISYFNTQSATQADWTSELLMRLDLLSASSMPALVTRIEHYWQFAEFSEKTCLSASRILIEMHHLEGIFKEENYSALEGGLLEAFGLIKKTHLGYYVCPKLDGNEIEDLESYLSSSNQKPLLNYLKAENLIKATKCLNQEHLKISGEQIVEMISQKNQEWKEKVSSEVATAIEKNKFFTQ